MSLAFVSDVTTRMGRALSTFTVDQQNQIQLLLDDAEAMLVGRIPLLILQANSSASTVSTENVVRIEASAVRRVMLNPGAFAQETIDGWQGVRHAAMADGLLYFTDEEWALLLPSISTARRGSVQLIAYGQYPPDYFG